jgi:hypothetical protein
MSSSQNLAEGYCPFIVLWASVQVGFWPSGFFISFCRHNLRKSKGKIIYLNRNVYLKKYTRIILLPIAYESRKKINTVDNLYLCLLRCL